MLGLIRLYLKCYLMLNVLEMLIMLMNDKTNLLKEMVSRLKFLQVYGQKQTYQFQKGLFISCKSSPDLYTVEGKYKISFLLTYKLNQDVLEHFFLHTCVR